MMFKWNRRFVVAAVIVVVVVAVVFNPPFNINSRRFSHGRWKKKKKKLLDLVSQVIFLKGFFFETDFVFRTKDLLEPKGA